MATKVTLTQVRDTAWPRGQEGRRAGRCVGRDASHRARWHRARCHRGRAIASARVARYRDAHRGRCGVSAGRGRRHRHRVGPRGQGSRPDVDDPVVGVDGELGAGGGVGDAGAVGGGGEDLIDDRAGSPVGSGEGVGGQAEVDDTAAGRGGRDGGAGDGGGGGGAGGGEGDRHEGGPGCCGGPHLETNRVGGRRGSQQVQLTYTWKTAT